MILEPRYGTRHRSLISSKWQRAIDWLGEERGAFDARVRRSSSCLSFLWVSSLVLLFGFAQPVEAGAGDDDIPSQYRLFVRGDANGDGMLNIGDPITVLDHLFGGGTLGLGCLDAGDFNDDEQLDVSDVVSQLAYQFNSGGNPPAPFPDCGGDPTLGFVLPCDSYAPCDMFVDLDTAAHVARRVGYGPTVYEYSRMLDPAVGISGYLAEQLNPTTVDETGNVLLDTVLSILDPVTDPVNILYQQAARPLYARRQLQENLTDFWENHFSTYVLKQNQVLVMFGEDGNTAITHALEWEWEDNQVFREEALGSFHDLLLQSATGKAMLVYLDGILNIAGEPNENYARELLELHTMGVDNGYTQADIEEVARCFTGWTICKKLPADVGDPLAPCVDFSDPLGEWSFHFEPANHDYDAKLVFPGTGNEISIPAGDPVGDPTAGIVDGFVVLQQLAEDNAQTAEFVSTKLIQKFITEDVPASLLSSCVATWLLTDGDLQQVVSVILNSPEFLAPEYRWNKVKTPMEHHVSLFRQAGYLSTAIPIVGGVGGQPNGLIQLSHTPFLLVTPDGYSEKGVDWVGTSSILHRMTFGNIVAHSTADPIVDVITPLVDNGVSLTDPAAIVDFWMQLAYQSAYNLTERQLAIDFLARDESGAPAAPLDPMAPDFDFRVRSLVGFVFSGSQFHKQ